MTMGTAARTPIVAPYASRAMLTAPTPNQASRLRRMAVQVNGGFTCPCTQELAQGTAVCKSIIAPVARRAMVTAPRSSQASRLRRTTGHVIGGFT